MSSSAVFDEAASTLTLSGAACTAAAEQQDRGALVGNGKVALYASYMGAGSQRCLIAGDFSVQSGTYRTNAIDTFRTSAWHPFSDEPNSISRQPVQQVLNMRAGIVTGSEEVTDAASGATVTLSSDMYAPRHLPYCTMQTIRITPSQDMDRLVIFQEITAGADISTAQPEFTYSVIDTGAVAPVPLLKSSGTTGGGDTVCSASAIVFDDPAKGQLLGFNVYRDNKRRCYIKMALTGPLPAGQDVRLHCLTAHMTTQDFSDPMEQCQAVLLSILTRNWLAADGTPRLVTSVLREQHVGAWTVLWATDVRVEAKPTLLLQANDVAKRARIAETLRKCVYYIYSSVRDGVGQSITPGSFSALDPGGALVYDGDLFLMPLLTLLLPGAARSVLEFRAQQLDLAQRLAAAHGLSGARYPNSADVVSLRGALAWDSTAPAYIFNSALVSLGVWNYFRLTRDREWLGGRGYAILRGVADFYLSRAVKDATTGTWTLPDVVALNPDRAPSADNAFTNNVVKLALRAAIEASHELTLAPRPEWSELCNGLQLSICSRGVNYDVVLYDRGTDADAPVTTSTQLRILEPLLVAAMPQLWDYYLMPGSRRGLDGVARCADYYAARLRNDGSGIATNYAALAAAHAAAFQLDSSSAREASLDAALANLVDTSGGGDQRWHLPSDVAAAAALPLVIAASLGGAVPQGGVAESRFYYQEMRLRVRVGANLPRAWSQIVLTSLGPGRVSSRVANQLTYS